MVMGGRKTINMPAVLYSGKDNIVRVGRQNARIEEGYNEVLVDNHEEFKQKFGSWLVPIECITNGEAFIIVRNNSSATGKISQVCNGDFLSVWIDQDGSGQIKTPNL